MKFKEFLSEREILQNGYQDNSPNVSIVMPTYCRNQEGLLDKCIKSVLNQRYRDFEFIIIDDGSSDGTQAKVIEYAKHDSRIVYIRHNINSGLPAIRTNEGILAARGQYVAFIFDDNVWKDNYLEVLVNEMIVNPADIQKSTTKMIVNSNESFKLGEWPITIDLLEHLNTIPNGAVLCRKEIFDKIGLYDPHLIIRRLCDWDLWLRAVNKGLTFNFVDKTLSVEYGPSSPVSLGLSVKLDYKITYAYMIDENRLPIRCNSLLPENIDEVDVFDMRAFLPYIRNMEEFSAVKKNIYELFFQSHSYYEYEDIENNRLCYSIGDLNPIPAYKSITGTQGKRRILMVSNLYNEAIREWKKELEKNENNIVLSCSEWQLSAYNVTDIDILLLFDCTAAFILPYLSEYRQNKIPVLYILRYGLEKKRIIDDKHLDYRSMHCIFNVLKCDLYFPRPGMPWANEDYSSALSIMRECDGIYTTSKDTELPFKVERLFGNINQYGSYSVLIESVILRRRIDHKPCYIFLNSGMISGSEIYGILIGTLIKKIGIDVQICIPSENFYGDDLDLENLNNQIRKEGLAPAIVAPYIPGGKSSGTIDLERIRNLRDWIEEHNAGMVIACSYILDLAMAFRLLDIPKFFALFQPTAYNSDDLIFIRQNVDGIMTDSQWAADLWQKQLISLVHKIPTIIRPREFKEKRLDKEIINIAIGGTLQPRKRQLEAIRACHRLIKKGYKIKLNIYGYTLKLLAHYNNEILQYITDHKLKEYISIQGLVEMEEIINKNEVILTTSIDESIPQTLLFAMNGGLVGVACPSGGINEVILDNITGYLATDFTVPAIEDVLERALNDKDNWPKYISNAQRMLKESYSEEFALKQLLDLLNKGSAISISQRKSRGIKNLICEVTEINTPIDKKSRSIESKYLAFSREIRFKRSYNIICEENQLSELGILFACEKDIFDGSVNIQIFGLGRLLREVEVSSKAINLLEWTYFKFKTIYGCGGKILTVEIGFNYSDHSAFLGVYEDRRNRNFIYKVFNKLGYPLKGINTLYVDCRK